MAQPITFVSMCPDAEAAEELDKAFAAAGGRARLVSNCDSASQLQVDLKRIRPEAAVLMLGSAAERDTDLIRHLAASFPEVALVTTSREATPGQVMNSLRAGAREFLQLPASRDELGAVLDSVAEFCERERAALKKRGRVVSVFSSKGGSGSTFVATNVAACVGFQTVLVDFNLQAGDAGSFLNLDPQFSVADAAKNLMRLDHSLLGSYVVPFSPQLSLLAAPDEPHEAEEVKAEHVFDLLRVLREEFRCVVIDLQHTFDPVTVSALDQSDDILLVMTLDIPGIRHTKRALKIFDRLGYPREKVSVVVNRWSKGVDAELKKVEGHIGERIVGFIPNDYKRVIDSINLGRPLVQLDPSSKVSAEVARIAAMLAGEAQSEPNGPPRGRGLLGSFFGRKSPATMAMELRAAPDEA